MQGFFNLPQSVSYKSERGRLSCVSCGLYAKANSPKMKPYGNFKKKIMVIGEAPSYADDIAGKPWQGRTGRIIRNQYEKLGINLFEDCLSTYAVNCLPLDEYGKSKFPDSHEVACCRIKVFSLIEEYKPKVVILHGISAIQSIMGQKWGKAGKTDLWLGFTIPDHQYQTWFCPTFSPYEIQQQDKKSEIDVLWKRDLKRAFALIEKPLPENISPEKIIIDKPAREVLEKINQLEPGKLAFDIETTGLKPYAKGHEIVSISFCYDKNFTYAMLFPQEKEELFLLRKIMRNRKIGKIAANMKYENTWLNILHKIQVRNWIFDTMQAAHILDNRPGITGLEFQAFVNFGIEEYSADISPYLKGLDANTPNRIKELLETESGKNKLLLYNGYDSLLTFWLAEKQMVNLGLKARMKKDSSGRK